MEEKNRRPKLIPGDTNCGDVPRKTTDVSEKTGGKKIIKESGKP